MPPARWTSISLYAANWNPPYTPFIPIVQIKGFETTALQTWDLAQLPVLGSSKAQPDHPDAMVTEWSVALEEYGYSLCKVFDEWVRHDLGKMLVSHFETLMAQHLGLPGSARRTQQIAMPSALVGCSADSALAARRQGVVAH